MRSPDDQIDLSPLDPEADPGRLDRVVDNVMERLGPGVVDDDGSLADEVSRLLVRRYRPICAAAAIVVLVSFAARSVSTGPSVETAAASSEGLSVPSEWSDWLITGETPSAEQLLLSLAGGTQ